MGLYLCIYDGDEELDGVEAGTYADFNFLRDYVVRELEDNVPGRRFPIFILHSDCDGTWSLDDCICLKGELKVITDELKARPAIAFNSGWQRTVAKKLGLVPQNALESFIDVDGEILIERFIKLVDIAIRKKLPIIFQ